MSNSTENPGDDSGGSQTNRVGQLLDDFRRKLRLGQSPTIESYVDRFPDLAVDIRETFSAVLLLQTFDSVGPQLSDTIAKPNVKIFSNPVNATEKIGDFRIVREIGRGGMGVVYEAIQESLDRRVALKVLPKQVLLQSQQLKRLQHEAMAVARLQHKNIVPVFAVGQHDGVCCFAMQYIDGFGIDKIIDLLRTSESHDICKLISEMDPVPSSRSEDRFNDKISLSSSLRNSDELPVSHSQFPSRLTHDFSNSSFGKFNHYRKIAEIGLEVAEALQHAHECGILHRDIKPSNLMLDRSGAVWVLDFGLAKVQENQMTQTGDIVGTLQYLPPERLNGIESAAGDLFSLGVSLYEMVTLTRAYFGVSRADLITQLLNGTPRRIREINSKVPRDLETIIHKSMSPDPAMRYSSAKQMADDLRSFLDGRAIRARPIGVIGRSILWAKRNPISAFLLSIVCLLFLVLLSGAIFSAVRFANDNALIALHLDRSIKAERAKGLALLDARISQAHALLESTQVGRSLEIQTVVREATFLANDLEVTDQHDDELRQILFDASGLIDIKGTMLQEKDAGERPLRRISAFDNSLGQFADCDSDGNIQIRDLQGLNSTIVLKGNWESGQVSNHPYIVFGPDRSKLAVRGVDRENRSLVQVWDLPTHKLLLQQETAPIYLDTAIAFVNDQAVAYASFDNSVIVQEIETGKTIWKSAPLESPAIWLAADRSGNLLVGSRHVIRLSSINGQVVGEFRHSKSSETGVFDSSDRFFAVAYSDGEILLWDLANDKRPAALLKGHSQRVTSIAFHPYEQILMSSSLDGSTILWDTLFARPILTAPFGGERFSANGDEIGFRLSDGRFGKWEVLGFDEKILADGTATESTIRAIDFSADSEWLGWASEHQGIVIASTKTATIKTIFSDYLATSYFGFGGADPQTVISVGLPSIDSFRFSRDTNSEAQEQVAIVRGYSVGLDASRPPTVLRLPNDQLLLSDQSAVVTHFQQDHPLKKIDLPTIVSQMAVDSSGKLLAISSTNEPEILIWSLVKKSLVSRLTINSHIGNVLKFDPKDRWLAISDGYQTWLYSTKTWKQTHLIQPEGSAIVGRCAFSPDGKLMAISRFDAVDLYETEEFKRIGVLRSRNQASIAAALLTESCPLLFSPNGRYLAAGNHSNSVTLWDIQVIKRQIEDAGLNAW